jgi:hypothetical protein
MFVFRSIQYLKLTQARNQDSEWRRSASPTICARRGV